MALTPCNKYEPLLEDSGYKALGTLGHYRKIGKTVYLHISGSVTINAGANATIGTLPKEYRPTYNVDFPTIESGGKTQLYTGITAISGVVTIYNVSTTNVTWINCEAIYMVD